MNHEEYIAKKEKKTIELFEEQMLHKPFKKIDKLKESIEDL